MAEPGDRYHVARSPEQRSVPLVGVRFVPVRENASALVCPIDGRLIVASQSGKKISTVALLSTGFRNQQ
jgi:hypothetical protein